MTKTIIDRPKQTISAHKTTVTAIAYSPCGRFLATGDHDGEVKVWHAEGQPYTELSHCDASIVGISFRDNSHLVTVTADGSIRLQNIHTRVEVCYPNKIRGDRDIAVSHDGAYVITGNREGGAIIWSSQTKRNVLQSQDYETWVCAVECSRDGKYFATCGYSGIAMLWDSHARLIASINRAIRTMRFSPDDRYLFLGTYDGSVIKINIKDVERKFACQEVSEGDGGWCRGMAFNLEGCLIDASDKKTIRLWNRQGAIKKTLFLGKKPQILSERYWSIAFSPNRKRIAIGYPYGQVEIWETDELGIELPSVISPIANDVIDGLIPSSILVDALRDLDLHNLADDLEQGNQRIVGMCA